ncbi:MAG: ribose 5-phosphate isomerase B [Rhodospirillales bacterium]|nr:ribose 5-phosphate isomerase B [Rhodospirillales bacterium]
MSLTVALASDHAGFELKAVLKSELEGLGHQVLDLGTDGPEQVDYPDFGAAAGRAVAEGLAPLGVIVCASGIGISIAANRYAGARAALCHDATAARLAREHNDANILALGSRVIGSEVAKECLKIFLATEFAGGRHQGRVDKLGQP